MTLRVVLPRCENLDDPEAVDEPRPRFSWRLEGAGEDRSQTAYRIVVSSEKARDEGREGDLWDSGRISSDRQHAVRYNGRELRSFERCFWRVMVWDEAGRPSEWSAEARWAMGPLHEDDWVAEWIHVPWGRTREPLYFGPRKRVSSRRPSPLLRKGFTVSSPVRRATLYASALGEYEVWVNGERAGNQHLAPEWTAYRVRAQYQAHDVTGALRTGENVLAATLADGWYIGQRWAAFLPKVPRRIRGQRHLILQLRLEYADGRTSTIGTNDSWRCLPEGPVQYADHYVGEFRDVQAERPGWDRPGFADTAWTPARRSDIDPPKLVAQRTQPIGVVEERTPVSVSEVRPGVFRFDFGVLMAGWCRIRLDSAWFSESGTVRLSHYSLMSPDGVPQYDHLLHAWATDVYSNVSHLPREFHPSFTYHGFRYVEVEGLKPGVTLPHDVLIACSLASTADQTGSVRTSDPSINALFDASVRTQLVDLYGLLTDVPDRSERNGWVGGETSSFCQTSHFHFDMGPIYESWLRTIRDEQLPDGRFTDIAPYPVPDVLRGRIFAGSPAWSDASLVFAWRHYLNRGDTTVLADHYPSAQRHVDAIIRSNPDLVWRRRRGIDFGDWLNTSKVRGLREPVFRQSAVPKDLFATAYLIQAIDILAKMADVLGRHDEAERHRIRAQQARDAFAQAFLSEDGRLTGDTQAGYALALGFDLLPARSRPLVIRRLVDAVARADGRLTTGVVTSALLVDVLARSGRSDLALDMLFSRRLPSWLFMIDHGATTTWERWDTYTPERGFAPAFMNSAAHYALASIGEWLYSGLAGLAPSRDVPGWGAFSVRPVITDRLEHVHAAYDSVRGRVEAGWERSDQSLALTVTVPANSRATVHCPEGWVWKEHEARLAQGDRSLASRHVGSGRHVFEFVPARVDAV